jgi:hypothetical protein
MQAQIIRGRVRSGRKVDVDGHSLNIYSVLPEESAAFVGNREEDTVEWTALHTNTALGRNLDSWSSALYIKEHKLLVSALFEFILPIFCPAKETEVSHKQS